MNDNDRDINAHSDVRSLFASDLEWPIGRVPKSFTYGILVLTLVRAHEKDGDVTHWTYIDQTGRQFMVFND